jgi:hypothetical protein
VDIHTLSATGQSISKKTIRATTAGVFDITLSQNADKTLWYALAFNKTNPTKDLSQDEDFEVVPNPANSRLHIRYNTINAATTIIELFDMTGKKVFYKKSENQLSGEKQETIDVQALPAGIYLLKLGDKMKKVMVSH